jgi:hypothetical protein
MRDAKIGKYSESLPDPDTRPGENVVSSTEQLFAPTVEKHAHVKLVHKILV